MILRFSDRRHPRHKIKCLAEIREHKLFIERTINFLPRLSHATTLDGHGEARLVEWGVAGDGTLLADAERWSLARTSRGKFG